MIISRQSQEDGVFRQMKRQYENKIMQFMKRNGREVEEMDREGMTNQTYDGKIIVSSKQLIGNRRKISNNDQNAIATTMIMSSPNIQPSNKQSNPTTKHPQQSLLRRKISHINTLHQSVNDIVQPSSAHNHKLLLQKIQSKITLMNEKIGQQISKQENQLLADYERRLKQKQELLNNLRMTTNQEMIKQKIMQRKQQLNTQKQRLIQSNMYYHQKMEQLKNLLNTLTANKQSYQHTLSMLLHNKKSNSKKGQAIMDASMIVMDCGEDSGRHERKKAEKVFFDCGENRGSQLSSNIESSSVRDPNIFVERVLGRYNQKSNILLMVNKRNKDKDKQQPVIQIDQSSAINDSRSQLPRIDQKHNLMVNSKSTQEVKEHQGYNNNQYHSYKRFNVNNFDRIRSLGVVGTGGEIMQKKKIQLQMLKKNGERKYDNSISNRKSNNNSNNNNINNNNINNSNSTYTNSRKMRPFPLIDEQTQRMVQIKDNLGYTKQYLQQFVIKKISKKQPLTTTNNNNDKDSNQRNINIKQKQKQRRKYSKRQQSIQQLRKMIQQLQRPLMIEQLFVRVVYQYYSNRKHPQSQKQQLQLQRNSIQQYEQQQTITLSNLDILRDEIEGKDKGQVEIQQGGRRQYGENEQEVMMKYKKCLTILQINQLDKRTVMDRMFKSTQFKRYLYRLIMEQLQPAYQHTYINNSNSPRNPFHQQQILTQPKKYSMLSTTNFKHLEGLLK